MTAVFDRHTKQLVRERSRDRCELCGVHCFVAHFHHRRPRGMGGTRRKEASGAANCLLVHPRCHAEIESSRERALANGWLVRQTDTPSLVPVKLWNGLQLLADDGSVVSAWGSEDRAELNYPWDVDWALHGSSSSDAGSRGDHEHDASA